MDIMLLGFIFLYHHFQDAGGGLFVEKETKNPASCKQSICQLSIGRDALM
jgi:hypothetical protein